jgi:hypothetical protein
LIKEELGSDNDVHLKEDMRMNLTLNLGNNKTISDVSVTVKKEEKN